MKKNLQWKLITILGVIILSVYLAYPPSEKISYGLDLQGGMHLVLQVITDDAINSETDQEILRLQDQLKKQNISYETISKSEKQTGRFTLQNFDPEKEGQIRAILEDYFKEWNASFSGTNATLTIKSDVAFYLRDQAVRQSEETLWNRVDELGLTEPTIQRQGGPGGERIIVELPGVEDPERVKNIKTTAKLEWKLVMGGPAMTEEALLEPYDGVVPEDMEVVKGDPKRTEGGYYLLSRVATVTGKDLRMARRSVDEWNNPAVSFTLNPEGGRRFATTTGEHVGENLAIVLDGRVQSAPRIDERIAGGSGRHGPGLEGRCHACRGQILRRTHHRALPRCRFDPKRAHIDHRCPHPHPGFHGHLLQIGRRQRHHSSHPEHPYSGRRSGLLPRQPHCARHSRNHSDHRYGGGRQCPRL
jgi:preprotein translocase subunit SecD